MTGSPNFAVSVTEAASDSHSMAKTRSSAGGDGDGIATSDRKSEQLQQGESLGVRERFEYELEDGDMLASSEELSDVSDEMTMSRRHRPAPLTVIGNGGSVDRVHGHNDKSENRNVTKSSPMDAAFEKRKQRAHTEMVLTVTHASDGRPSPETAPARKSEGALQVVTYAGHAQRSPSTRIVLGRQTGNSIQVRRVDGCCMPSRHFLSFLVLSLFLLLLVFVVVVVVVCSCGWLIGWLIGLFVFLRFPSVR